MKVASRWVGLLLALTLASPVHAEPVVKYIHTDHLGTPIAATDENGNVIERFEYEPYGLQVSGPVTDGPGYTGHVEDAATSLTYMQQRYYDPQIGTFLSVDPVTAHSNPVSQFSRYRYANGNPYAYTDPDGRYVTWIHRRMTYNAAIQAGYSESAARKLADAVVGVDKGTQGNESEATNLHYMAGIKGGAYQSTAQAIHESEAIIGEANPILAQRLHALQDKYAPMHGGRQWMPFWQAPDLASMVGAIFSNLAHFVSDMFISPGTESAITSESAGLLGASGGGSTGGNSASDSYATRGLCGFALVAGCNSATQPLPGEHSKVQERY